MEILDIGVKLLSEGIPHSTAKRKKKHSQREFDTRNKILCTQRSQNFLLMLQYLLPRRHNSGKTDAYADYKLLITLYVKNWK